MLNLLVKNWKLRVWRPLLDFFHVICKISNFDIWTGKHLAQASTELTVPTKWAFRKLVERCIRLYCSNMYTVQTRISVANPSTSFPRICFTLATLLRLPGLTLPMLTIPIQLIQNPLTLVCILDSLPDKLLHYFLSFGFSKYMLFGWRTIGHPRFSWTCLILIKSSILSTQS